MSCRIILLRRPTIDHTQFACGRHEIRQMATDQCLSLLNTMDRAYQTYEFTDKHFSSLLDRIRPSRSTCSAPSGRRHQGLHLHRARRCRRRGSLRLHTILCSRDTENHEPRVPGAKRRISQGEYFEPRRKASQDLVSPACMVVHYLGEYETDLVVHLQSQKVEPITGVSAEDWKGGYMVQSKPSEK